MGGHHLILGELEDFITGEVLEHTHDEEYRQKIAQMLVNKKGYAKSDILPRQRLEIQADKNKGLIFIDFKISVLDKIAMIIKYAPGSLVTRHRPVLAMSRLVEPYQIPVVVVTNGKEADILNGDDGKLCGSGLEAIPAKNDLIKIVQTAKFTKISPKRTEMESRIVYVYEIDGACPCDTTICKINTQK